MQNATKTGAYLNYAVKNYIRLNTVNDPETFFKLYPDIEWQRIGITYIDAEHSGIKLWKDRKGIWQIKNHSGQRGIPKGDVYEQAAHILNVKKNQVKTILEYLAKVTGEPYEPFAYEIGQQVTKAKKAPQPPRIGRIRHHKREDRASTETFGKEVFKPNAKHEPTIRGSYTALEDLPTIIDAPRPHSEIERHERAFLDYWENKAAAGRLTLERYNIVPIATYTTPSGYQVKHYADQLHEFNRTSDRLAFAIHAGANVKIHQPNNKKYKWKVIQNVGNYVFGYDQLKHIDTSDSFTGSEPVCIIAAGESDALAINALNCEGSESGQRLPIWAISLQSETANIPKELLSELYGTFAHVAAVYDNDQTGKEQAKETNAKGIPAAHIGEAFPDCNDLCEAKMKYGAIKVYEWLEFIAHRKPTPPDPTRKDPTIHHPDTYYKFKAKRYIKAKTIHTALKYHNNLLVNAPTGTGKSTSILNFVKLTDRRIIYAAPTITIAKQMNKAAGEAGIHTNLRYGNTLDATYKANISAPLFICTYDSLDALDVNPDNSILIIDEQHEFIGAYGYRAKAIHYALNYSKFAAQSVYLSATPDYLLSKHINSTLLSFDVLERPTMNIQAFTYTAGNEAGVARYIHEQYPTGKHLFKKDHTAKLKAMAKSVPDRESVIFSNKVNTKKTAEYQRLLDGHVNEDFIFCTKLLESGASILDEIETVNIINPRDLNEILQVAARARMNNGKNETIQVNLFFRKANRPGSIENHEYTPVYDYTDKLIQNAKRNAERINTTENRHTIDRIAAKTLYIRYNELEGKYIADIPAIIYEYRKMVNQVSTSTDLLARLQAAGAEILPAKEIEMEKVSDDNTIDHRAAAIELLETRPYSCIHLIKGKTEKLEFIQRLNRIQDNFTKPPIEDLNIDEPHKKTYEHIKRYAARLCEIMEYTKPERTEQSKTQWTPENILQAVCECKYSQQYEPLKLRAHAIYCKSKAAGEMSELYGTILKQIDKEIDKEWSDRRKSLTISKYKAREIVRKTPHYNSMENAYVSQDHVWQYLAGLYQVKKSKNTYEISTLKSPFF